MLHLVLRARQQRAGQPLVLRRGRAARHRAGQAGRLDVPPVETDEQLRRRAEEAAPVRRHGEDVGRGVGGAQRAQRGGRVERRARMHREPARQHDLLEAPGADVRRRPGHHRLPPIGSWRLFGRHGARGAVRRGRGRLGGAERREVAQRPRRLGSRVGARLDQGIHRQGSDFTAHREEEARQDEPPGGVAVPGRRRGPVGVEGEAAEVDRAARRPVPNFAVDNRGRPIVAQRRGGFLEAPRAGGGDHARHAGADEREPAGRALPICTLAVAPPAAREERDRVIRQGPGRGHRAAGDDGPTLAPGALARRGELTAQRFTKHCRVKRRGQSSHRASCLSAPARGARVGPSSRRATARGAPAPPTPWRRSTRRAG